jgi:hypothetical protein
VLSAIPVCLQSCIQLRKSLRNIQRVFELIAEPTAGPGCHPTPESGNDFRKDKALLSSEAHESGQFFEHIRIVSVARSKVEWVTFEPSVSKSGGLGTLVSAYEKRENHELLCVSRSAWGGSPPPSILRRFERWISDRNIQHLRRGYGVPCVGRKN